MKLALDIKCIPRDYYILDNILDFSYKCILFTTATNSDTHMVFIFSVHVLKGVSGTKLILGFLFVEPGSLLTFAFLFVRRIIEKTNFYFTYQKALHDATIHHSFFKFLCTFSNLIVYSF